MIASKKDIYLGHPKRYFGQIPTPSHSIPTAIHIDSAVGTPSHILEEGQVQNAQMTFTEADFLQTGPFSLGKHLEATASHSSLLEQQLFQFREGTLAYVLNSFVTQWVKTQVNHLQEGPINLPEMLEFLPLQLVLTQVQSDHEPPSGVRQCTQCLISQFIALQLQSSHETCPRGYLQQYMAETTLGQPFHFDFGLSQSPVHIFLHKLLEEHLRREAVVRAGQLKLSFHLKQSPHSSVFLQYLAHINVSQL